MVAICLGVVDRRSAKRNAEADRRAARELAAEDRRTALRHARLLGELDALVRLAANQRRGGSLDEQKSRDMGAEAATLAALIGPERLPHLSSELNPESEEELRVFMAQDSTEEWQKRAAEAHLALLQLAREIRAEQDSAAPV